MKPDSINRIIRSIVQVLTAIALVVPTVIGLLGIDAVTTAKITAALGAVVVAVVTIQNKLEDAGILPRLARPLGDVNKDAVPPPK